MSDDVVIRRVRAALAGKRVLVVSNRKDAQLKKALDELLGTSVRWYVIPKGGGSKTRSATASIAGGAYDVVIALTSFMKHGTGNALRAASQRGGATYILAGRGRPTESLRALDRDLGLQPAAAAAAAAAPSRDPDEVMRLKRRLTRRRR